MQDIKAADSESSRIDWLDEKKGQYTDDVSETCLINFKQNHDLCLTFNNLLLLPKPNYTQESGF